MRFILFLSFLLTTTIATAQNFVAGLKAGISTSQVSGDNLSGFRKAGFAGGLVIERTLTEKISSQMEMLFVQKGSRKAANPTKGDYTFFLLSLNYVEVPVMLKFKKDKFTYEAGLSFGRLLSSTVENESGLYPALHPESRPFYKEELSINAGINYPLFKNAHMNWRFSRSILPIRNHQGNATFRLNRGQYNTVLEFTINYMFRRAVQNTPENGKS